MKEKGLSLSAPFKRCLHGLGPASFFHTNHPFSIEILMGGGGWGEGGTGETNVFFLLLTCTLCKVELSCTDCKM